MVYPNLCQGCTIPLVGAENVLCTTCLFNLPETNYHLTQNNPIEQTFWGRVPVERAFSFLYFKQKGIVQNLLHGLKYKNKPEVGEYMGKIYGAKLKQAGFTFDYIVPVPLHKNKQRIRGYNQSECFAIGLCQALQIKYVPAILVRKKATATQTKKARFDRWQNVETVFSINKAEVIKNKKVLLVDDVITTGATIEACAQGIVAHTNQLYVASIACVQNA